MNHITALSKISTQVTVLNVNKARNLLIARKRIHLDAEALQQAIDDCDVTALQPECAELLLKFPPTAEEVTMLFNSFSLQSFLCSFFCLL